MKAEDILIPAAGIMMGMLALGLLFEFGGNLPLVSQAKRGLR